jgi:hypothetical protein
MNSKGKMNVNITIDDKPYMVYSSDNVLLNDAHFFTKETTSVISGKYYGSSTCLEEQGWIAYWDNKVVKKQEKKITITILTENPTTYKTYSANVSIPDNFHVTDRYFTTDDKIIKTVFIRDLHRFGNPVPLEISGIEFSEF